MSAEFTPHTADELASMRATIEASLTDTCTLVNPPATANVTSDGGVNRTPVETPGIACRRGPSGILRPEERVIADKLSLKQPATITFKHDQTGINEQTQVKFGSGTSARIYQVYGFASDRSEGVRLSQRWVCERVR